MRKNIPNELSRLRRDEGNKSVYAFAKIYMKHHLQYMPSAAHIEIYHLLDRATAERGKKIAIAAPRDFGKSTLITLIYVVYCICYSKEKFVVIISNTASQANQILDNIKKELSENELLRSDFPEIFESRLGLKHLRWREGDIITRNEIKILALGSGQQIRGRRFGIARPSLVIGDDLEDSENTFSLEVLDKRREWLEKSVLRVGSETTNFIIIGNLFHPHSLLSEYVSADSNSAWMKKVYSAIVTWPKHMDLWDKWSSIYNYREEFGGISGNMAAQVFYEQNKAAMDEEVKLLWGTRYKLYDLMKMWAENELSFMSEMQNMPRNPATCILDTDRIAWWDHDNKSTESLMESHKDTLKFYIGCDPSLGLSTVKGDPSAIVVLMKDAFTKTLYIVVADIKRRQVEEIVETILAYHVRFLPVKIGIEANQFQRVLIDMVKKEGEKLGLYPIIEPMIHRDDQISRIQTLRPRIISGNLQFSKKHRQLMEEMRYFPKGRHDDGLDALEMAVRLSSDDGVMFWLGGGSKTPPPNEPIYPTADGLVPYGWYKLHRAQ